MREYKLNRSQVFEREQFIIEMCKNKNVLHLGCADWPYTLEKLKSSELLHEKLFNVAAKLVGVDMSRDGIEILKHRGFKNLYVGNVESLAHIEDIKNTEFDVILAGEIIEHVGNVVNFLTNCKSVMTKNSVLLITTPNAFSIKSILRVALGKELVHPEHFYYFSIATIQNLLQSVGLTISGYHFYTTRSKNRFKEPSFKPMELLLKFLGLYLFEGLIILCRLHEST